MPSSTHTNPRRPLILSMSVRLSESGVMGMGEGAAGYLVTFKTPTGFELDGIVFGDERCSCTIVHVHGSLGNFYQNRFIRVMGQSYPRSGIRLLSFNLSAHDGLAEGYRDADSFEYAGGSVVDFQRCTDDIDGAVAFARRLGGEVVLQGHSMGCDRVLHYLLTRGGGYDFVLLGPCDSYRLQEKWIGSEGVEEAGRTPEAGGASNWGA